jgi:hypothetical protein
MVRGEVAAAPTYPAYLPGLGLHPLIPSPYYDYDNRHIHLKCEYVIGQKARFGQKARLRNLSMRPTADSEES